MTKVQKQRVVTNAAHPRFNDGSTISDGQLKLVYNVYTSAEPSTVPEEDRLNLVFLHGNGFSKECWEYMIQQAFDDFGDRLGACVSIDFYNHNESYQLNKHELGFVMAWIDGGHDMAKVTRDLMFKGPVILVGHSMGAVSAMFAAHYDTRVFDSVVAIDPVCYSLFDHEESVPEVAYEASAKLYAKLEKMRDVFKDERDYAEYIDRRSMYSKFHPKIRQRFKESNMVRNSDGTVSLSTPAVQQMMCFYSSQYAFKQTSQMLESLDKEVLHLSGDTENFILPGTHTWIRSRLQHCTVAEIPDGTHTVPFERPDETWVHIKSFLEHRLDRALTKRRAIRDRRNMSQSDREEWVRKSYQEMKATYRRNTLVSKL